MLQDATAARTASDAAAIKANPAINSETINIIDNAITAQLVRTDTDIRIYNATVKYNADLHEGKSPAEIIQSDSTRVFLDDVMTILNDSGYRVSVTKTPNLSKGDSIKIKASW